MLRTHFIVKPRIQIKYMFVSLVSVCITALVLYYAFWNALVNAPGMDQMSGGDLMALYRAYNMSFIWVIVIVGVAVTLISIFYLHRLVGPIFSLERVVKAMAHGDFPAFIHLRKHDELKEMAGYFQQMSDNLRTAVKDDQMRVENVKKLLDEGKIAQAKEELSHISRWYKI